MIMTPQPIAPHCDASHYVASNEFDAWYSKHAKACCRTDAPSNIRTDFNLFLRAVDELCELIITFEAESILPNPAKCICHPVGVSLHHSKSERPLRGDTASCMRRSKIRDDRFNLFIGIIHRPSDAARGT